MIDTHAHIDAEVFDIDRDEIIENAFSSGLEAIIIPSIEPDNFSHVLEIAESNEYVFCGLGIHPHSANDFSDINMNFIADTAASNDKVVAIGETGLDYYYDFAPKAVQQENFRQHLKLAKSLSMPVIVHNRDSDEDLMRIISQEQDGSLRGVLHCFSDDEYMLEKALDLNFLVSFTGNITFKKSQHAAVIEKVPEGKFMIETDAPYMTPVPFRGKRNEPKQVRFVAEKIAAIKSISFNEVVEMTTKAAKSLFKLPVISLIAFLLIFVSDISMQAQGFDEDDIYYEDEYLEDNSNFINYYHKNLGIGFTIGPNTVVESHELVGKNQVRDISYEGIVAFGGTITYGGLLEYLVLSGTFLYSSNKKIEEQSDGILKPTNYRMYEFVSHWIPNPYNRVNVYAMIGGGIMHEEYSVYDLELNREYRETVTDPAIITGLGFFFNVPFQSVGMLSIAAEWRLNFSLSENKYDFDPSNPNPIDGIGQPVNITKFYSIPRLSIIFYPEF